MKENERVDEKLVGLKRRLEETRAAFAAEEPQMDPC
jgi:hypothetical protein